MHQSRRHSLLSENQIETIYIDPGSRWQNGYTESFHSRFRDECLGREMFPNFTGSTYRY